MKKQLFTKPLKIHLYILMQVHLKFILDTQAPFIKLKINQNKFQPRIKPNHG